jgi:hypothetical protein
MLRLVGEGLPAAMLAAVKTGLARMKANVMADLRAKSLERNVA